MSLETTLKERLRRPECFSKEDRFDPETPLCGFECIHRRDCSDAVARQQRITALRGGQAPHTPEPTYTRPFTPTTPSNPNTPLAKTSAPVSPLVSRPVQSSVVVTVAHDDDPKRELMVRMACAGSAAALHEAGRFMEKDGHRLFQGLEILIVFH